MLELQVVIVTPWSPLQLHEESTKYDITEFDIEFLQTNKTARILREALPLAHPFFFFFGSTDSAISIAEYE